MALTKHQKLARGIKSLFEALNAHRQKVAFLLEAIQFHFYEPFLIKGHPLMKERALQAMMYAHRTSLALFSPNAEIKTACNTKPLIGCVITPPIYPETHIFQSSPDRANETWWVPWCVKIQLPSQSLKSLDEAYLEAILYCASEAEMSEWIDWFEQEDKAKTLTNQFFSALAYNEKRTQLKRNLVRPALPFFQKTVESFLGKWKFEKLNKTFYNTPFVPNQNTSLAQAYELVICALKSRKNRHLDDFKRYWRDQLEELIFENLHWTAEEKEALLREWIPLKTPKAKIKPTSPRWNSSLALDRQGYASFIRYFAEIFLQNPIENQAEGEIVLLLWLMVYISQTPDQVRPIKELLTLTTANINDRALAIDNIEVELSMGLASLFHDYAGEALHRQRPLFPNLSIDLLEDAFRKASKNCSPLIVSQPSLKHFSLSPIPINMHGCSPRSVNSNKIIPQKSIMIPFRGMI
jgi:hypothetical protein